MHDRCLRCDYMLVCSAIKGTDIVKCARCDEVDVIIVTGPRVYGKERTVEKLCDVEKNTTYGCRDTPYKDYPKFGEGTPYALCDECARDKREEVSCPRTFTLAPGK